MVKRYQRGNQKPKIKEGQTTQWFKRYQKGGNQKPKVKEGQTTQWSKENDKRTNKNLQDITQKNKDRATRTLPKTGCELMSSGRVSRYCSICSTRRATLATIPVISHV